MANFSSLPVELHHRILMALTPSLTQGIYKAAFEMEWEGNFKQLPPPYMGHTFVDTVALVQTRDMYHRLQQAWPSFQWPHIAMQHKWFDLVHDLKNHHKIDLIVQGHHIPYLLHLMSQDEHAVKRIDWAQLGMNAARHGDMEAILMARKWGEMRFHLVTAKIIKHGHLHILMHLCDEAIPQYIPSYEDFEAAARYGKVEIFMYLLEKREGFMTPQHVFSGMLKNALGGGQTVMVKHLCDTWPQHVLQNRKPHFRVEPVPADCVDYLLRYASLDGFDEYLMYQAAAKGDLELVRHLNTHHSSKMLKSPEETERALKFAAENGHLDVLKYLLPKNEPTINVTDVLSAAIQHNHLGIIHYLELFRTEPVPKKAFKVAAIEGSLEAIQFYYTKLGKTWTPFPKRLLDNAAYGYCSMDGLKPFEKEWKRKRHLDLIKYLHKHQFPSTWVTANALDNASLGGCIKTVKFLHENYPQAGATKKAMDNAACNGHLNILQFLHENRTEGCSTNIFDLMSSSYRLHIECAKFLRANKTELTWSHRALINSAWNADAQGLAFYHGNGKNCKKELCGREVVMEVQHVRTWYMSEEQEHMEEDTFECFRFLMDHCKRCGALAERCLHGDWQDEISDDDDDEDDADDDEEEEDDADDDEDDEEVRNSWF
ncbi:hypothetical protein BJ741DRAFT_105956 [Chytriomyces cf. hyalinus JEL632]|nr:hypothetical protein BJ741DRAFT_105956 [Chytriomyces cf. hyalinus JEL632]